MSLAQTVRARNLIFAIQRDCQKRKTYVAHAHFVIGVDLLVKKDQESAKQHFQSALQTNHFRSYAYWWSQALLERLEDPNWLRWLHE